MFEDYRKTGVVALSSVNQENYKSVDRDAHLKLRSIVDHKDNVTACIRIMTDLIMTTDECSFDTYVRVVRPPLDCQITDTFLERLYFQCYTNVLSDVRQMILDGVAPKNKPIGFMRIYDREFLARKTLGDKVVRIWERQFANKKT